MYLTTNGREPSEYSAGEANKSCILSISYKETIANWLANCIKLAAQFPLVRETIIQYYNLVNEITYQETNNSMDEKITNLLLDGINFDLALKLDAEFANTRNKFFEETFVEITMKAAESLGKKLRVYDKVDFSASEVEFGDICTDGYSIVFGFEGSYKDFYISVYADGEHGEESMKKIKENLQNISGKNDFQKTSWTHWQYIGMNNNRTVANILKDREKTIQEIKKTLNDILSCI